MKQCSYCKEIKPLSDFYKNRWTKDGLCVYCKDCQKKINKKYYDSNKEKHKKRVIKYYQENKEKMKQYYQEYYQNNKDNMKKSQDKWRNNNKEKIKEYYKKYYQHPKVKEKHSKYTKEYYKNNREKIIKTSIEWNCKKYGRKGILQKKCICCGSDYTTLQPQQKYCSKKCGNRIKARKKEKGSRQKLKWIPLYTNPFDKDEKIDYHHINDTYTIPLPSDIHCCYSGYHTRYDNEDLDYIIEQIYPSFSLIKNSLRSV